jgi:alanine racemase
MANTERAVAYIDLGILEENFYKIKAIISPETGLLCVVKADAYGHGAVEVSRRIESLGVIYLGVATIDEAVKLRAHKIKTPILVMSGVMPWEDVSTLLHYDLTPVVYDLTALTRICSVAKSLETPLKIHLKFDTGMGRLGFMAEVAPRVMDMVEGIENIHVEGLMSHFSSSEKRDESGLFQVDTFRRVLDSFIERGFSLPFIHMANSGAIINYPEAHFTMVRTGISLYGSHSSKDLRDHLPTRQVMKFVSKVALIRDFPAGYALSYGRTYITKKKTRVAYIPVGYADGYPRALSGRGSVLINDRRCDVIGRICMDWFLVDITDHEEVTVQDEAILLGESTTNIITADEIAEITGTIPYEILCKISKRVTRIYVT